MGKDRKQTTVSQNEIDPFMKSYRDAYVQRAFGAANQPLRFYGMPGYQQNSPWTGSAGGAGSSSRDMFGRARGGPGASSAPGAGYQDTFNRPPEFGEGADPWVAGYQGLDPFSTYRNEFLNPYQDEVIGRQQAGFDRQRQVLGNRTNDLATKAGAFGGSRHAVLESIGLDDIGRSEADSLANLNYAGWDRANQLGMQQQGFAGHERDLRRNIRQSELDAGRYRFDQAQGFPQMGLGLMQQALQAPQGSRSTNTQTQHGNLWNDIVGLGTTAAGFFMGGPAGGAAAGAMRGGGGGFSVPPFNGGYQLPPGGYDPWSQPSTPPGYRYPGFGGYWGE